MIITFFLYACVIFAEQIDCISMEEHFSTNNAPKPVGLYPHARRVGSLLFLSGVGPRTLDSKDIPGVTLNNEGKIVDYDIEKQCHSVFNNIKVILEDCGSCWEKIIDVQVFLTNMKDDFKKYNKIKYINKKNFYFERKIVKLNLWGLETLKSCLQLLPV